MMCKKLLYFFVVVLLKCGYSYVLYDSFKADLSAVNAAVSNEIVGNEIGEDKDLRLIYPGKFLYSYLAERWCIDRL